MKYRAIASAILAIIIYSCASKSNVSTATLPKKIETTVSTKEVATLSPEIAKGKELYENNCAKCHILYETSQFSAEEWKPIVARMRKKAHLEDLQAQLIYNYVTMK